MAVWKEKKVGKRKWKFTYTCWYRYKPRIPKVSKVIANQYAIKKSKDSYDLILRGRRYRRR